MQSEHLLMDFVPFESHENAYKRKLENSLRYTLCQDVSRDGILAAWDLRLVNGFVTMIRRGSSTRSVMGTIGFFKSLSSLARREMVLWGSLELVPETTMIPFPVSFAFHERARSGDRDWVTVCTDRHDPADWPLLPWSFKVDYL